jgi:hypothetical protein
MEKTSLSAPGLLTFARTLLCCAYWSGVSSLANSGMFGFGSKNLSEIVVQDTPKKGSARLT